MRKTPSASVVLATLVAAATAQDVGSPVGRLVDIGGRRLHLHCTGTGSPTVVIEAGASSFSKLLAGPTRRVENHARVFV